MESSGSRHAGSCGELAVDDSIKVCWIPRLIRFRDAPRYLGMDRNRFNAEVRPHLTEIPIGIAGDRLRSP